MRGYKTLILAGVVLSAPHAYGTTLSPVAALEPLQMETRYDGSFAGLALGRVRVTFDEQAKTYHIRLDTKSRGIASIFSSMKSIAEASGMVDTKRSYVHQLYTSTEDKNGKEHGLDQRIVYNKTGAITEQIREPRDDISWRPLVPTADANTATDPITAYLALRQKLQQMLTNNTSQTELCTYDGARLATMKFTLLGRTEIEIMDKDIPVIETRIERLPMLGYTTKEWKKFREGDPEIHVYFSDDARLLPVLFTISLALGDLRIELAESKPLATK